MRGALALMVLIGCGGKQTAAERTPSAHPKEQVVTTVVEDPGPMPPLEGEQVSAASDEREPRDECAELPWEQRTACWGRAGYWPHAPALSAAEWAAMDIENMTMDEVVKARRRAVTGDVCAAVNSKERDPWKRWSPALFVESMMGIWVVEGENAYEKMMPFYARPSSTFASEGLKSCGSKVVFWSIGIDHQASLDALAKHFEAAGVRVLDSQRFEISARQDFGELCPTGRMWRPRCLLALRFEQLRMCNPTHRHYDRYRAFCATAAEFISSQ